MLKLKKSGKKDTSVLDFGIGIVLLVIGVVTIFKNTSVGVMGYYGLFGSRIPSGIVTIPILVAIVLLILNHKSRLGWTLLFIGIVLIIISIIFSVRIVFHRMGLLQFVLIVGGTFGGIALIARALLR